MAKYTETIPAGDADAVFTALTERMTAIGEKADLHYRLAGLRSTLRNGATFSYADWSWILDTVRWYEQRAGDIATSKALDELYVRLRELGPDQHPDDRRDDDDY